MFPVYMTTKPNPGMPKPISGQTRFMDFGKWVIEIKVNRTYWKDRPLPFGWKRFKIFTRAYLDSLTKYIDDRPLTEQEHEWAREVEARLISLGYDFEIMGCIPNGK